MSNKYTLSIIESNFVKIQSCKGIKFLINILNIIYKNFLPTKKIFAEFIFTISSVFFNCRRYFGIHLFIGKALHIN